MVMAMMIEVEPEATGARCIRYPAPRARAPARACRPGPREPLMAAQPVMPGFMRWRWAYSATSLARSRRRRSSCRRMRPRADQRHLALQHVDQLRQLVEAGAADEAADAGDARVVDERPAAPRARRAGRARMERNFQTRISSLLKPCRRWRKSTGPGLSSLMARATSAISGRRQHSASDADHQILQRASPAPAARRAGAGDWRQRHLGDPRQTPPRGRVGRRVDEQHHLVGQHRSCSTSVAHPGLGRGGDRDHDPVDVGHDAVADEGLRCRPARGTPAIAVRRCGRGGRRTRPAPPPRGSSAPLSISRSAFAVAPTTTMFGVSRPERRMRRTATHHQMCSK